MRRLDAAAAAAPPEEERHQDEHSVCFNPCLQTQMVKYVPDGDAFWTDCPASSQKRFNIIDSFPTLNTFLKKSCPAALPVAPWNISASRPPAAVVHRHAQPEEAVPV